MTFHYILWLDDKDFWLLNDSFSSRFWTVEWFATYLTKLILTLRTWTLTLPSILHYSLGHLPFYLFLLSLDSIHRWLPSCLVFRLNRWGVMSGWHNTYKKNGFYITIGIRRALCFVGASLPHNYRAYGTTSNFACNRFQALFYPQRLCFFQELLHIPLTPHSLTECFRAYSHSLLPLLPSPLLLFLLVYPWFGQRLVNKPVLLAQKRANLATVYSSCKNSNQVALTFVCFLSIVSSSLVKLFPGWWTLHLHEKYLWSTHQCRRQRNVFLQRVRFPRYLL